MSGRADGFDFDDAFELPGERRRASLSLAALIDVTFILLIFFMLVSQFTRLAPVKIPLGEASAKVEQPQPQEAPGAKRLRAVLQLHANGAFMVNGRHYQASIGLPGAIDLLNAYFDKLAKPAKSAEAPQAADGKKLVLLDPDPGVNLQQLINALSALKKRPDFTVNIVMSPIYRQLAERKLSDGKVSGGKVSGAKMSGGGDAHE